jgi:5-methylthioadenosine/S-adenosylhomocysteine deaminase
MSPRLLSGATVVTVDRDRRVLHDGAVLVNGDRIADVGATGELLDRHRGVEVLDCSGRVIIPGLVNTHTHLFQTLLKGLGDDRVLKDWFTCMTGPSAVELTPEDAYAAARHGAVEALLSGTTTIVDFMYVHPRPGLTDAVIRALQETGIRALVGRGYVTAGVESGVPAPLVETVDAAISDAHRLVGAHNRPGARVQVGLAPAMIWTVDEETLRRTRQLADDLRAPVMMHVSETDYEIEYSRQHYGTGDVEVLERFGVLGPDLLAVHCVQCTPRDLEILRAHGVAVSHNPCSNLYLASGFAPVPEMVAAGIAVGLASDGPASNNNHNLIQAMKFAALVHKGHRRDSTIITAEQVLEMATIEGARAIGRDDDLGSIELGKKADLVVLRMDNFCVTPMHHPVSALVYSAIGNEPETVLVDGVVVVSAGRVTTVDEADAREESSRSARELTRRAGTAGLAERPWTAARRS